MIVLAQQGEELLIPALIVALVLIGPMIRQRFGRSGEPPADHDPGVCAYCGVAVTDEDERCPACGFRRRARATFPAGVVPEATGQVCSRCGLTGRPGASRCDACLAPLPISEKEKR